MASKKEEEQVFLPGHLRHTSKKIFATNCKTQQEIDTHRERGRPLAPLASPPIHHHHYHHHQIFSSSSQERQGQVLSFATGYPDRHYAYFDRDRQRERGCFRRCGLIDLEVLLFIPRDSFFRSCRGKHIFSLAPCYLTSRLLRYFVFGIQTIHPASSSC